MDALARSGRLLLRALPLLLLVAACSAPPLEGVGRPTDHPVVSAPAASADAGSPIAPDFAARLTRVGAESFVSWGHAGGRYSASLYVTPAAKDALFRRDAPLPDGTELVLTETDKATRKPGPTYFMKREAPTADASPGAWRYGIVDGVARPADAFALCARCHAEAGWDGVFAVPK